MSWASRAGTPRFLSSVAVVCRRWCTLIARSPCVSQMRWNDRTRFRGSIGLPGPGREDEAGVEPGSGRAPRGRRPGPARRVASASAARPSSGQVTAASAVLTGPMLQLAVDALDLLADADARRRLVDVMPAQAEDFTAAHAVQQQEHERRIERVVRGGIEEGEGLGRGPGQIGLAFPGGQFDQAGDVAGDQFLAHSPGQGRRRGLSAGSARSGPTGPTASWPFRNVCTRGSRQPGKRVLAQAGLQVQPDCWSHTARRWLAAGWRVTTFSSQ